MPTIEDALVYKMLNTAAITALIGSGTAMRLYPLVVPETAVMPAIAYQKIDSQKTQAQASRSGLARSRFQFTCQAATYLAAKSLSRAVIDCWWGWRGVVSLTGGDVRIDGALVDGDSDTQIEHGELVYPVVHVDVVLWHAE